MCRYAFLAPLVLNCGLLATAAMADATYGELAGGAESISDQSGVHAEICRDHLFNSATVQARLPRGYRLAAAAELGTKDERLSALIRRNPRYASYAVGSLCFILADSFVVDGVRAHGHGPTPMAFWWAHIQASDEAGIDLRIKGNVSWVQLGSWYSDTGTDEARILHTDPMAEFVDVRVAEVAPGRWHMQLVLPTGVVSADVRTAGPAIRRNAPQPGYMTVLFSGDSADAFTVFTYFGHHHREATGQWRATGNNMFARAFGMRGEADAFDTFFQEGWQARAGLYRR